MLHCPAFLWRQFLGLVLNGRPISPNRLPPLISEEGAYDPNRDTGDRAKKTAAPQRVSPLAFLIGPVQVIYSGHPTNSVVAPLASYIDAQRKMVRSNTGEISMDVSNGVCIVNAPKAQGASGFLQRAGVIQLADVRLACMNEYATVLAVALDDQPLRVSRNILLQIGTQARPAGWQVHATTIKTDDGKTMAGFSVSEFGRAPWQVIAATGRLSIANAHLTEAVVLDANGMAVAAQPLTVTNGMARLALPPRALYCILR